MAKGKALDGKPYAGNLHVRFDEGEVAPAAKPRRGSLLYKRRIMTSLCAIAAVAMASATQYSALSSGCRAITTVGCIDTRDTAIVGGDSVVVETRDCDTNASSEGIIDLAYDLGIIMFVR